MKSPKRRKKLSTKHNVKNISQKFELQGLFFVAFALLAILGMFGFEVGFIGVYLASFFRYFFGIGAWIAIFVVLYIGIRYILKHEKFSINAKEGSFLLLYALFLALYHHVFVASGEEFQKEILIARGGMIGGCILLLLRNVFGMTGGLIVIILGTIGGVLVLTKWSLAKGFFKTKEQVTSNMQVIDEGVHSGIKKAKEFAVTTKNKFQVDSKRENHILQNNFAQEKSTFYDQNLDEDFSEKEPLSLHQSETNKKSEDLEVLSRIGKARTSEVSTNEDRRSKIAKRTFPIIISNTKTEANVFPQYVKEIEEKSKILDDAVKEVVQNFSNETLTTDVVKKDIHVEEKKIEEEPLTHDFIEKKHSDIDSSVSFFAENIFTENRNITPSKPLNTNILDTTEELKSEISSVENKEAKKEITHLNNRVPVSLAKINSSLDKDLEAIQEKKESENEPTNAQNLVTKDAELPTIKPYELPRPEIILDKHEKEHTAELEAEITENAHILEKTLENFKVKAKIVNACHGPAVTRYELEPAPGVKVSKIVNLSDDLALALAAFSVRIEPIAGKPVIGIEVPNKILEGVHLREVLETDKFLAAKEKLTIGLGVDIGGEAILADLAKMPHLLVAGATGSGKSVCINTIITSILFKARPDEVKFILIDPKMVELSNYNNIPHLMVPVVTDAKKAASVLNWAVQEMENRYGKFAKLGVRDMARYNAHADISKEETLPFIVIIIDELADLMMVAPHDVEDSICRLAQKARAAGLHLVLATQRPSVDVITGIIKANIPSRISFAVSSQIDSRTILDTSGAEKLLGKGDMLFAPVSQPKPCRVQGAFISDDEVERLLEFIRAQGQEIKPNEEIINFTENALQENANPEDKDESANDPLLEDVVLYIFSIGQASVSSIQRKFRMGYTRAARLVDTLEEYNIIGPNAGSKARDLLVSEEEARNILGFK